jgi:hypothetical protein
MHVELSTSFQCWAQYTACLCVSHYDITITKSPVVSIYFFAAQCRCHMVEGCSHCFRSIRSHEVRSLLSRCGRFLPLIESADDNSGSRYAKSSEVQYLYPVPDSCSHYILTTLISMEEPYAVGNWKLSHLTVDCD